MNETERAQKLGYASRNNCGRLEYQPPHMEPLTVNVGADSPVTISKLFGPLCAENVRVRMEYSSAEWVVERQNVATDEWEEKARWFCQESYPEDDS